MSVARTTGWLLCVLCAVPAAAHAGSIVRDGFYAGAGYGGGWASVELDEASPSSRWSGTLQLRAGWALEQNLLLGGEYARWAKGYSIATLQGDVPYEVALQSVLGVVTYFPGNGGFVVRAGIGAGFAGADIDPPPQTGLAREEVSTGPGFAFLAGAGYEVGLTNRFALAAQFDALYLGIGDERIERAYLYGLNAEMNWYW